MPDLFLSADQLSQGGVHFAWTMLPGAHQAEAYARGDVGGVLIDMQHGLIGYGEMVAMVAGVQRGGKPAFVRPPLDDFAMVSRALDAGAAAIIMPMINTAEDAQRLVQVAKYPPLGERSWGPFSAINASGLDGPGYLAGANALTRAFAMIETAEALKNVKAICAVEGVDGVFVGPYDLSISLSGGAAAGAEYPGVQDALPVIAAAAQEAGKIPGIYASNSGQVQQFAKLGYRFISIASDLTILAEGLAAARA
jgi:4-hydroxy-2-oxoheptanedioate aldolase